MIATCTGCGSHNRVPAAKLNARAHCGSCKKSLLPLDHPIEIDDEGSFDELIQSSPLPVVVDFWAPWCGPCRMVAPELVKIAQRFGGRAVVAKVNTDQLGRIAERYGIRGIPTLIRFDKGGETKRISGAQGADGIAHSLDLERSPRSVEPALGRD